MEHIKESPYLQWLIGNKKDDDDDWSGMVGGSTYFDKVEGTLKNKCTLILDATCKPADIKYPTDLSLLNEAPG